MYFLCTKTKLASYPALQQGTKKKRCGAILRRSLSISILSINFLATLEDYFVFLVTALFTFSFLMYEDDEKIVKGTRIRQCCLSAIAHIPREERMFLSLSFVVTKVLRTCPNDMLWIYVRISDCSQMSISFLWS